MKHMCRDFSSSGRERRLASRVLGHARIVTDPKKLGELRAEAARRKRRAEALREVQ
jgi:hypothetical protein